MPLPDLSGFHIPFSVNEEVFVSSLIATSLSSFPGHWSSGYLVCTLPAKSIPFDSLKKTWLSANSSCFGSVQWYLFAISEPQTSPGYLVTWKYIICAHDRDVFFRYAVNRLPCNSGNLQCASDLLLTSKAFGIISAELFIPTHLVSENEVVPDADSSRFSSRVFELFCLAGVTHMYRRTRLWGSYGS